ncbi:MAG TPA: BamA/TamA family outer membrane protein, partial [Candidatus Kapabacteria bacterium]|nr:BamA/TamA family outer membrane protein [Candidatus Kapabacteria bacterium]
SYDSISRQQCFAEEAVLQELEFKQDDAYSDAKRSKSEENLMRLGPFESARIELRTQDADSAHVAPTIVHLKLRKKFDFTPDFVVDNNYGFFNLGISATAADHNLFCAGQEASLSGSYEVEDFTLNKNRLDLEAKFLQPRIRIGDILDYKKTSLQLGLGAVSTTFPLHQLIYSASALLSHHEAEHTYLIYQLSYVQAQTTYDSAYAYLISPTSPQYIQKQPNLLASVSITRDNTDNLFVPSRGSSGVVTIKINTLPTPYYWKIEATQKWFVPWGTQSVFGFRLHGGIIGRFGSDPTRDIILDEKFYVGGAYSLRGWPLYQLGIGVPYDTLFGKTGFTLFEANAEWRYQWFILPDNWIDRVILNRISSDFFIDAGNIWSERQKWDWVKQMPQQIAIAVGFGLRYDTPVGPLRLDFGYKLYDPDTESLQHLASFDGRYPFMHLVHPQLQIAIGNAF